MRRRLEEIYHRLPAFVQDFVVTAYGYKIHRQEYGAEFERLLEDFERQQWFSPSEMEAFENEKLRSIISHAYQSVPYYRNMMHEYGLTPEDFRSIADLAKLPTSPSDILVTKPKELVADSASRKDRIVGHTSGTTGRSKQILYDRHVCRVKNVVDWRMKKAGGLAVDDPIAYFMGRAIVPIEQSKPPFWRRNRALNHLLFSVYHFAPQWYDAYFDALDSFGAKGMDGYPSSLSMFGEALLARGRQHPLKAAFVSSELCLPHHRRTIEKAFGCEVFDYYGMAERAVFAVECEWHKGLHLNSDFGHCELLDENEEPVPAGKSGRVVITGWHNRTMPLIRVKTNDWATASTEPCSCGRPFPLLRSIDGRQEDQLATPDGRYLDVSFVYEVFAKVQDDIRESQVVQEADGSVVLRIIPGDGFGARHKDILIKGFQRYMGSDTVIRIEECSALPRTKSGKFRWLVSNVRRQIR